APIGRAADSKSACWEFESLHPCHYIKPQRKLGLCCIWLLAKLVLGAGAQPGRISPPLPLS
ncbi:hypothetical protein OAP63_15905, partial [Vibrio sp.]|nr:hypothetical protein [Vibrio sp.]